MTDQEAMTWMSVYAAVAARDDRAKDPNAAGIAAEEALQEFRMIVSGEAQAVRNEARRVREAQAQVERMAAGHHRDCGGPRLSCSPECTFESEPKVCVECKGVGRHTRNCSAHVLTRGIVK